jgi:hypothetical protein
MPVVGKSAEALIAEYEQMQGPAPDSVRAFFHALTGWGWRGAHACLAGWRCSAGFGCGSLLGPSIPSLTKHTLNPLLLRQNSACPPARSFLAGEGPEADAQRSKKFKLVPAISKGSWIIRQSVGTTPVLLGQKLTTSYSRGANYFEVGGCLGAWVPVDD